MRREKKGWMRAVALVGVLGFALSQAGSVHAQEYLKPKAAAEDGKTVKALSYGLSGAEKKYFHDRFREEAPLAFAKGEVVNLIGHQAISDSDLEKSVRKLLGTGEEVYEKEAAQRQLKRVQAGQAFLKEAMDDATLLRIIDEFPTLPSLGNIPFLSEAVEIRRITDKEEKIKAARKFLLEDTRFAVFLKSKRGVADETSLYSLGDPASPEHKAFVMHMGSHGYAGSEDIVGGARTLYPTLARLEGFARRGEEGLAAFRDAVVHEFKDYARGWHRDESPAIMARLERINRDIDRETAAMDQTAASTPTAIKSEMTQTAASAVTAITPETTKKDLPRVLIYSEELRPWILTIYGAIEKAESYGTEKDRVVLIVPNAKERSQADLDFNDAGGGEMDDDILVCASVEEAYDILSKELTYEGKKVRDSYSGLIIDEKEPASMYPKYKKFIYFATEKESVPDGVELKIVSQQIAQFPGVATYMLLDEVMDKIKLLYEQL